MTPQPNQTPFGQLENALEAALSTYSNVHRGSGHHSRETTRRYEAARATILASLDLDRSRYTVLFGSPRRLAGIAGQLSKGACHQVTGEQMGVPLGTQALAIKRNALEGLKRWQTGGGTARLISPDWVVWARMPDRFEAGTPAIVPALALAEVSRLAAQNRDLFFSDGNPSLTVQDILYGDDPDEASGMALLERLRNSLIGQGFMVPSSGGEVPFVNFDNGASTPTFRPVWDAYRQTLRQPEAVRSAVVEEVKSICASFLGAPASGYDILFTSNTTEAINLVAESLEKGQGRPVVVNTLLEHNSNDLPWRNLAGGTLLRLPASRDGFIDAVELDRLLADQTGEGKPGVSLVAVTAISNVLGAYTDLEAISRVTHKYGARLLVDAAQLVAHRPVDMDACGIDYLVCSAHKAYAPFGTGLLVARRGSLSFNDGEMAAIRASGEANAAGIAAFGKALLLLRRIGFGTIREVERALTEKALAGLAQMPGVTVYGMRDIASPEMDRKGGVIIFTVKDRMSDKVAKALSDQGGIGIRAGCHCAHILIKHLLGLSPGLQRFQRLIVSLLPGLSLPGVARVSFGLQNTEEEVERFLAAMVTITNNHK